VNVTGPGDRLSISYVHDDKQRREAFDHQLAAYIRRRGERWDLAAIVEALDLLGRRVRQVDVDLRRQPGGTLSVTFTFGLPPHRA
jgi:hypothetical protein